MQEPMNERVKRLSYSACTWVLGILCFIIILPIGTILFGPAVLFQYCFSCGHPLKHEDASSEAEAQVHNYSEALKGAGFLANWIWEIRQTHPVLSICLRGPGHPFGRTARIAQLLLLTAVGYLAAVLREELHSNDVLDWEHQVWKYKGVEVTSWFLTKTTWSLFVVTFPQLMLGEITNWLALLRYKRTVQQELVKKVDSALDRWTEQQIELVVKKMKEMIGPIARGGFLNMGTNGKMCPECPRCSICGLITLHAQLEFFSQWAMGYFGSAGIALLILAFYMDMTRTARSNAFLMFMVGTILSWCVTFFALSLAKFYARWWWQHSEGLPSEWPLVGKRGIVLRQERLQLGSNAARLAATMKQIAREHHVHSLGDVSGCKTRVTYEEFECLFKRYIPQEQDAHQPVDPTQLKVGEIYEIFVKFRGIWSFIRTNDPGYIKVQLISLNEPKRRTTTALQVALEEEEKEEEEGNPSCTVKALQTVPEEMIERGSDYSITFKLGDHSDFFAEVDASQVFVVDKLDMTCFHARIKEAFTRIDKDQDGELNLQNDLSALVMELIGNSGYSPLLPDVDIIDLIGNSGYWPLLLDGDKV